MTILFDTDLLIAAINRSENSHRAARAVLDAALGGSWGEPLVTDYILDEGLTLLMARHAPWKAAERLLILVLGDKAKGTPKAMRIVRVSDDAFSKSMSLFRRHYQRGLSFTDCASLAVMEELGVERVASFDSGFDGLVERVQEIVPSE